MGWERQAYSWHQVHGPDREFVLEQVGMRRDLKEDTDCMISGKIPFLDNLGVVIHSLWQRRWAARRAMCLCIRAVWLRSSNGLHFFSAYRVFPDVFNFNSIILYFTVVLNTVQRKFNNSLGWKWWYLFMEDLLNMDNATDQLESNLSVKWHKIELKTLVRDSTVRVYSPVTYYNKS